MLVVIFVDLFITIPEPVKHALLHEHSDTVATSQSKVQCHIVSVTKRE